jgi:catechol 2,3-dioxygenase-like lactoylglutathione lyase family enzyme
MCVVLIEQLDQLLKMHEDGVLDRRQLLGALLATLAAPGHPSRFYRTRSVLRRGRTLNHVTLSVADISRSTAFYGRLLGLEFKSNRPDQATGQLENGALVLDGYEGVAGHPRGIDHFCVGLDTYEPQATLTELRREFPNAVVSIEGRNRDQVYIRDPDGARVQLCAADYKP